jgi:hypothetical protein
MVIIAPNLRVAVTKFKIMDPEHIVQLINVGDVQHAPD